MLTFNLKKEWFEKIKSGEKTHEYRRMTPYWETRICNAIKKDKDFTLQIKFCCGCPKNDDKEKILLANVIRITQNVDGLETDLKINELVFDIEFELIKEKI